MNFRQHFDFFLVPYQLAGGTLSLLAVCQSVSLSVCPSVTLQFSRLFSAVFWDIDLKFSIWICHDMIQIKFELSSRLTFFIRPTCRDVLWYGVGVCLSVRPSVCPSVHKACRHDTDQTISARTVKLGTQITYDKRKNPIDFQGHGSKVKVTGYTLLFKPCKHDTDWTVSARTVKLGTQITYDERTTLIDFQGHGSKVKVTRYTLLLNLVNTIQTEPFQLGPSNLAHRLLMTERTTPIDFQGHWSKVKVTRYTLLLNLVNTIQTEPFQLGPSNLVHRLLMARGRHLLTFKVMGQRSRSHNTHCC